jgi:hypothetical protein
MANKKSENMKRRIIILIQMVIALTTFGQNLTIIVSASDEHCGHIDGEAHVTAYAGTGNYSYIWNTTPPQTTSTITGLSAGIYVVTVTDSQDTVTANDTVNDIGPSCVICYVVDDTLGLGQGSMGVCVSGGGGNYNYLWSNQQPFPTAYGLIAGIYTVTVCDQYTCCCSSSGTIQGGLAITETDKKGTISFFPNPTNGIFSIDLSNIIETDFLIELSDIIGKIVYTEKMISTSNKIFNIDISGLTKGFYYLRIYNKDFTIKNKILKE